MPVNLKISVVTPVYGCKDCLAPLAQRLKISLEAITQDYEIIMVNDASPDAAWEVIRSLAAGDSRIKGINLSRNFGQHYAITAGLDACSGDWVVVMDSDLQDRPEEIPNLYNKAIEGFDVIFAERVRGNYGILKKAAAKIFYKLLSFLTNSDIDGSVSNFGIFSKNVIAAVSSMREQLRWFPTFVKQAGFRQAKIPVEHPAGEKAKSGYTAGKLFDLAVNVIVLNSNKPLRLVLMFGFSVSGVSILYAVFTLVRYLRGDIIVLGWASIIVSIWFLAGVIIFMLGIVGIYIGKIFDQIKQRPLYIIKERIN